MGLVPEDTSSWKEDEYSTCNVNTCWELCAHSVSDSSLSRTTRAWCAGRELSFPFSPADGVTDEDHFPASGSRYDITISSGDTPFPAPWLTKWNPLLENGYCANCTISEAHNATTQHVVWTVTPFRPGGQGR
eukprot:3733955-Prymnesium_polylepis.1